ncbi:uncharacterized protein LOC114755685 [Neltuma alba]|uniref:uncharacterized protein LOC114755685 n=1 Tax=Neltuma alba TaxID=207710 RepID=UPI0010A59C8A|nr:uncharacterized protein LOC114755685 [Prosopis alba]
MPFHEIDVILGLNWLSTHNILLDYKNRTLIFPPHKLTPRNDVKLSLITGAQAGDCLRHGYQGYVVFFSVHAEVEEGITEIPVACDFLEVFLTEISRLPPEREVEFAIDLVPGAGPISKAPDCMAPNEIAKLKKQLEELSEKNFIQPSVSP